MDFNTFLRKELEKRGLSQQELADMAGISRTAVWNVVQNKNSVRLTTALRIIDVLGLSTSVFNNIER